VITRVVASDGAGNSCRPSHSAIPSLSEGLLTVFF
jgi:hypothetical protein